MVSVKYIAIVLRADDEGEGGTFAVYSLLSRYVRAPMIRLVGICVMGSVRSNANTVVVS